MTFKELVEKMYKGRSYTRTRSEVEGMVRQVFDILHETVKSGDEITIPKFGTFRKVVFAARDVRNLKGNLKGQDELIHVPERWKIGFRPSIHSKGKTATAGSVAGGPDH